jgi:hypothetical protein
LPWSIVWLETFFVFSYEYVSQVARGPVKRVELPRSLAIKPYCHKTAVGEMLLSIAEVKTVSPVRRKADGAERVKRRKRGKEREGLKATTRGTLMEVRGRRSEVLQ